MDIGMVSLQALGSTWPHENRHTEFNFGMHQRAVPTEFIKN